VENAARIGLVRRSATAFALCSLLLLSVLNFQNANADSLPPGTSIATGGPYPVGGEIHVVVVSNSGPQTITFSNPSGDVIKLFSSVTNYVSGAVLYFDSGGFTYSQAIVPASNTMLTFSNSLSISNVRVSIANREFPDDAVHVGYFYGSPHPDKERAKVASSLKDLFDPTPYGDKAAGILADYENFVKEEYQDPINILIGLLPIPSAAERYADALTPIKETIDILTSFDNQSVAYIMSQVQAHPQVQSLTLCPSEFNYIDGASYFIGPFIHDRFSDLAQLYNSNDLNKNPTPLLKCLKEQLVKFKSIIDKREDLLATPTARTWASHWIIMADSFVDAELAVNGVFSQSIVADPPFNILVLNPDGKQLGTEEGSGLPINQIQDSIYSGTNTNPQVALIFNPIVGDYQVLLLGTSNGLFSISLNLITSTVVSRQSYDGFISSNEILVMPLRISETGMISTPPSSVPVGGEILGIDISGLFVAGAFANVGWILPIAGLTAAGIVGYILRRRIS
jgi:hypothetical protein